MRTYALAYFDEDFALRLRYVETDDYRVSKTIQFKHPEQYKPPGLYEIDVFEIKGITESFDPDMAFAEQLDCRHLSRMFSTQPAWSVIAEGIKNPVKFCEQLLYLVGHLSQFKDENETEDSE